MIARLILFIVITFSLASNVAKGEEPYIGEIRMFGGSFAPRGWALCNGQLMSVSEYTALFALVGRTYGGDGRTTFGLPDLRGRVPVGVGKGQGSTQYVWGKNGGAETTTLKLEHIPGIGFKLPTYSFDATKQEALKFKAGQTSVPGNWLKAKWQKSNLAFPLPDGKSGIISPPQR